MADFILGRLKFHFKGDWVTATAYIKDDVVRYGGNTFVAMANHTASALFETDLSSTKWKKMVAGTEWKGAWAATTYYKVDDVVQWGGSTFACNTAHTSQADLYDDTAKWTSFVPGFNWTGTYTNGTAYKVNDLAKYGANVYICTVEHTAASTIDTAKFGVFVSGLEFEDSWNSGTAYQAGDVVTYGGYNYIAEQQNTNEVPYDNSANWVVLTTGWKMQGTYAGATAYKTGDVVRYGGHTYVAKTDATGIVPTTTANWDLLNEGFNWRDTWADATAYAPGDGVAYGSSSYRCKLAHTSSAVAGDAKRPDYDSTGVYWDLLAEGDSNFVTTTRGDILTRNATQNARLPIGTTGAFLKSDGTDVSWEVPGVNAKVYYVAKHGVDALPTSDSGRGTSENKPWLTMYYALDWMKSTGNTGLDYTVTVTSTTEFNFTLGTSAIAHTYSSGGTIHKTDGTTVSITNAPYNNGTGVVTVTSAVHGLTTNDTIKLSGIVYTCSEGTKTYPKDQVNKVLYVKTGEYEEKCPMIVPANTQLIGDGLRSTKVKPAAGNSTATGLTNTPNARADMLRVREGTTITGFSFSGLEGTMGSADGFGVARPNTTDGATRSGVCIALDPGTGTSDTSVHITAKSPFVQNCTHFGTGSVGIKIDGDLHAAGLKSILANDFTQITSDGIGVWTLGKAVTELVSVFTYYCHHGYLADSGSIIRCLNSNNSYGEYGSTAAGIDAAEVPYTGEVDLRNNEATVGRALVSGSGIGRLELEYAGEGYSSATIAIAGSGASGAASAQFSDGAVNHITVATTGSTHFTTSAYAQSGTSSTIKLAASDSQPDDFYNGMRITIYTGTGYGNTGVIADYVASTKTCSVQKNNGSAGFDVFVNSGLSEATTFDTSSGYEIEPRVSLSGGGSPTRDALARAVVENQQISKILILDGGAGYTSAPSVTITDPNASTVGTATSTIGDGVISQTTITTSGSGYKTETTSATVTGNGFAEISSEGTAFVRLTKLPGFYHYTTTVVDTDTFTIDLGTSNIAHTYSSGGTVTKASDSSTLSVSDAPYNNSTGIITITTTAVHGLSTGDKVLLSGIVYTCPTGTKTYPAAIIPAGGDIVEFAGISGQAYYIVAVTGYASGAGLVRVNPKFTTANKPTHAEVATLRSNYSNIRLTGHDFLDIGTGDFTSTNYPNQPSQAADPNDEVFEADRGRVFYSSTDQDGNFRVGNLFKIEQATGKATLNAEAFDLSGLQELSLGSSAQGNFGATINEFSTDGTLADNSDTALVTERGIKTYVDGQLGGGQNDLSVNSLTAGSITASGQILSTTGLSGTDVNLTISTQNDGIISFTAKAQTALTPTTANDLVNKSYVDAQGTPTLQTLSIDDVDLSLKRRVITNANELIQKESAYFDGTDAAEGFEFINGTMQINIDKAGDLVIETI